MITIVDYGMGNLRSVRNAIEALGGAARVSSDPGEIAAAEKLVLPGVGSFPRAMQNIRERGLEAPLHEAALQRKIPVLGICLGMQLLATRGREDGGADGLGWIRGEVVPFDLTDPSARVPHVGFNAAWCSNPASGLFGAFGKPTDFYFVHSYFLRCDQEADVSLWCDYHGRFCAGVERDNVFGTQFHPEKSQANGLALISRFLRL